MLLKWTLNEGIARWQMATGTTLLVGWVHKGGYALLKRVLAVGVGAMFVTVVLTAGSARKAGPDARGCAPAASISRCRTR